MKFSLFTSLSIVMFYLSLTFITPLLFLMTSACAVRNRVKVSCWHFRQHNQKKRRAATAESEYGELCQLIRAARERGVVVFIGFNFLICCNLRVRGDESVESS
jgi:hypothetical protein